MFFETEMQPADLIMIPGGSHPQLMERAAALYHQGLAPLILPSGGRNPHLEITEWEFLRNTGIALGVPDTAILEEDRAANTFQNASFSWDVLQQAGIQPHKVILVCKNYHARRVLLTYQTVFPRETEFRVLSVIDKTGITKDNWFRHEAGIKLVMTEMGKVASYFGHHIPNWVI
ncbi:hypothetical protein D3C75_585450 [compost metagenome]